VRGHKIPATGKGHSTLGFERFLHLFFKSIISICNALRVLSDEIFFNVPCQLQAFGLNFVVKFAHTRVIDFNTYCFGQKYLLGKRPLPSPTVTMTLILKTVNSCNFSSKNLTDLRFVLYLFFFNVCAICACALLNF